MVTAVEITREFQRLPQAEQSRVIEFARLAGESRPFNPGQLGQLATRMVEIQDPAEVYRLQEEIVRGCCGCEPQA